MQMQDVIVPGIIQSHHFDDRKQASESMRTYD